MRSFVVTSHAGCDIARQLARQARVTVDLIGHHEASLFDRAYDRLERRKPFVHTDPLAVRRQRRTVPRLIDAVVLAAVGTADAAPAHYSPSTARTTAGTMILAADTAANRNRTTSVPTNSLPTIVPYIRRTRRRLHRRRVLCQRGPMQPAYRTLRSRQVACQRDKFPIGARDRTLAPCPAESTDTTRPCAATSPRCTMPIAKCC